MSKQRNASAAEVQRAQEQLDAFVGFLVWCVEHNHTITEADVARAHRALDGDDDALLWLKTFARLVP